MSLPTRYRLDHLPFESVSRKRATTLKNLINVILLSCLLLASGVSAQDDTFSFATSMELLSNYEQDITKIGPLDQTQNNNIRQALNSILSQSEQHLTELNAEITQKRQRLTALLEEPTATPGDDATSIDDPNAGIKLNKEPTEVTDPGLLRNKEALEIDLVKLETTRKKASLVSVYAKDLLTQLAARTSEQSQERLLFKAPSLLKLDNWQKARQSIAPAIRVISGDIIRWVSMVSMLGLILIYFAGPFLYRSFAKHYSSFMPTNHFPSTSFFAIFILVLITNCFYFVFITQERHLELAFLVVLILNTILATLLFRRLSHIRFASQEKMVDGERIVKERQWLSFSVSALKLLTAAAAIASFVGYTVLSMYVLHNIVITLTAVALFLSLRGVWISSEQSLSTKAKEQDNSLDKKEGSLFLLTIVELGLAVVLFLTAARFWGVSLNNFQGQSSLMRGELQIGSLTIGFGQLFYSLVAFLIVFYFFSLIRWFLRERIFKIMRLSLSSSEAVLAIFGYMGFTFAIMASLNALGVQWENLAIIAGALSVGIGFGLQTIISNFVSGLILLFERPVRVGDWVILGNGLEGHIKKVNMRSTEIMTLERSSVLIPNSNLLSDTITNWTLHDQMGRQDIPVGVAYGSDTEQVKQVLLEVARGHSLLRRYPQPQVLFKDFGDSSLDFVLRVFLKNINDRHRVGSDLRFEIDSAFRENDISIPFPQRDLHIKKEEHTTNTEND